MTNNHISTNTNTIRKCVCCGKPKVKGHIKVCAHNLRNCKKCVESVKTENSLIMKQAKFFLKYKLGLLKETKNEKKGSLNSGAKIQSATPRIEIGLQKNLLDFNDGNNSLFMADPEKKVIAEKLLREYSDNFLSVYESFFLKAERVTLTDMARESVHVNNKDTTNTNETTKANTSTPAKAQDIRESETEGSGDQNDVQADTQTTNNHQTINSNCNSNTPNTPITISTEEKIDRAFAIATNVARTYYLLCGYDTQFNKRIQNIEQRVQRLLTSSDK